MRISEVIERFGGVCEGDASVEITGVMGIDGAGPFNATFATDDRLLAAAEASAAGCVIVPKKLRASSKTIIRCDSPQCYAADLMEFFSPPPTLQRGIHPTAIVGDGSIIDLSAHIGPYTCVGKSCRIGAGAVLMSGVAVGDRCVIGERSVVYPNVTLYANTQIGARVIVHAGAVLGADGFGYFLESGEIRKWPHVGNVVIEDDVEIGANACIDRAKFGTTLVQRGTKIDNLVQVGHNCRIGRNVLIAGQTGLSGSVVLEDWVTCGGQVGIGDHKTIGRGVRIGAQTGIFEDIPAGLEIFGYPARPGRQALQETALLRWLNEHRAVLRRLVRKAAADVTE